MPKAKVYQGKVLNDIYSFEIDEGIEIWENLKHGTDYIVLGKKLINATNENDGDEMVLYLRKNKPENLYVREVNEFHRKFKFKGVIKDE